MPTLRKTSANTVKTATATTAHATSPERSSRADLLFEIGTEELPAAYLDGAIAQLRDDAQRLLGEAHLDAQSTETFGTPRRLVLLVRGLDATQRHPAEEIRGPSAQAASRDGKPSDALLGFLRSRGGELSQIKTVDTGKGEYVYLVKPERRTPAASALPGLLATLVQRLRFPKTMRWDASGVRFARPIRWLLALNGAKPIRVTVGKLVSSPRTIVGGPKRPKSVAITSLAQYLSTLQRAGVVLDQRQRREQIERLVRHDASRRGGVPVEQMIHYGLLDEVAGLVEQPIAQPGAFDKKYLELPREVLLASMAKHQRVFAVETRQGTLQPSFIGILDGSPRARPLVAKFMEHILNARLADSLLFWQQDRRRPLEQHSPAGVTFHERLGSMDDKAARLMRLSEPLAEQWGMTEESRAQLQRAARLAKADLVTTMVKEFPTLQGTMGRYYARAGGEPHAVADAIGEQYLPTGGTLPKTLLGAALAVLDKYDTLTSYFGIDIFPSGDQDPFGLRRAAQGIVETVWSVRRPFRFDVMTTERVALEPEPKRAKMAEACQKATRYLLERLASFDWPAPVPTPDVIAAVLGTRCADLLDTMERIVALQRLHGARALLKAAKVVERTHNILKSATVTQDQVDPARLQEAPEQELWRLYSDVKDRVQGLIAGRAYADATTAYGETFFEPLNRFFDSVMVNVKDAALQQNRLALLRAIKTLYTDAVADLSKLAILQQQTIDGS
jgi:glycyl-tRNA synthetase beta chain